jgi:hypothetical protein
MWLDCKSARAPGPLHHTPPRREWAILQRGDEVEGEYRHREREGERKK